MRKERIGYEEGLDRCRGGIEWVMKTERRTVDRWFFERWKRNNGRESGIECNSRPLLGTVVTQMAVWRLFTNILWQQRVTTLYSSRREPRGARLLSRFSICLPTFLESINVFLVFSSPLFPITAPPRSPFPSSSSSSCEFCNVYRERRTNVSHTRPLLSIPSRTTDDLFDIIEEISR